MLFYSANIYKINIFFLKINHLYVIFLKNVSITSLKRREKSICKCNIIFNINRNVVCFYHYFFKLIYVSEIQLFMLDGVLYTKATNGF